MNILKRKILSLWIVLTPLIVMVGAAQAAPLWYSIQPLPQSNYLYDIACSTNECVAVGAAGASVNIRPNASMIAGEPYSDAILYRVMRDTNEFLSAQIGTTADTYSRILRSTNGYRWAATGGKLYSAGGIIVPTRMIKAGNQYVVTGYDFSFQPFIATSPDAINWNYITPPTTNFSLLYDMASNPAGNILVAVGNVTNTTSKYVYTSTDSGATWVYPTTPATQSLKGVTWDTQNNQFVAVGFNGTIITSTDGINWVDKSIVGATVDLNSVVEHQGLLVAVGFGGSVYSSDAGVTWNYGLNAGANMRSVAWNGSAMLAVGAEGDIRASYDGFLWFEWDYVEVSPPTYNGVAVNDLYTVVAAGSNGRLDYSLDSGGTWVKGPSSPLVTETYDAIEWVKDIVGVGTGKFVAVGNNLAKTSSAGTFWIAAATPPGGTVVDLAYNNPVAGQAKLVAVGGTSAYTSTDGNIWTTQAGAFALNVQGVAASPISPYTFVAVGSSNTIYSSADSGVTWVAGTSPITLLGGELLQFNDVFWTDKYGGGIFFAVGTKTLTSGDTEGVVIYSYNGTTWFDITAALPVGVRQNKKFLSINGTATGLTSEINIVGETSNQFSPAGIILENTVSNFSVWQQVPLPATPALNAVVPTNIGGAIAVGRTSVIISKLNDTTPPSQIVAPADLIVEATDANPIPISDGRIQSWLQQFYATDNRDITILDIQNNAPATFAPNTVTPITFTVSDKAGNTILTPVVRNITIQDRLAPVVTAPASISLPSVTGVLGVTNAAPAIVAYLGGATATDNVDGVIAPANIANDAPSIFPIGTTTVTFSATDSGMPANTGTASSTVVVWDAQAPTINLPSPAHYTIAATGPGDVPFTDPYVQQYVSLVTAFDNWDPGLLDVYSNTPVFPVGTQVFIDFYATDAYGNVGHNALNSASITVQDLDAPVITPPSNITIPSTSGLGVFNSNSAVLAFTAGATAVDNVDLTVPVTDIYSDVGSILPIGTTKVTFFTDDKAGNRGFASANVTVWDAQAPVIYLPTPSDFVLSAETAAGLPLTDPYVQQYINAVVALDDYEGSLTVTNDAPATFAINNKVVITFTATDTYGNIGTAVGSITVIDDIPPVITPPANISVLATSALGTDVGNALIQSFLNHATATDNVDTTVTVFNDAPSVFPIGTTKVTFFADDSNGNRSFVDATVEVTAGSGGTPDAASCLVSGQPSHWSWLSLLLMAAGIGVGRIRKEN